ncbi:MAG: hypothetical protein AAB255_02955 [Bacteroidota bacterium]
MYDTLVNEAAKVLNFYKKGIEIGYLWKILIEEGKRKNFAVPEYLSDFVLLIEGDKRFNLVSEEDEDNISYDSIDDPFEKDERKKLNLSELQIVKLQFVVEDDDDEAPSLAHSTAIAKKMQLLKKKILKKINPKKNKKSTKIKPRRIGKNKK